MRILNGQTVASEEERLDRGEWELMWALRDLPPGPRKQSLMQLLHAVVDFVSDPGCGEAQADGVPCATASSDCAQCRRVDGCLHELAAALRRW